jgi:hypothetical protein
MSPNMVPMDDNTGIPVMRTPANVMVTGLNSDNLASSAVRLHPVDRMQRGEIPEDREFDRLKERMMFSKVYIVDLISDPH